jgi:hypothetical protein
MATFSATFQATGDFTAQFEENQSFTAEIETITERVPSNYGLITRVGNSILVS